MNNLPYPYFPGPFGGMPQFNLEEEINNIKRELFKLNERIENIENKKTNNYLKKDDSLNMI